MNFAEDLENAPVIAAVKDDEGLQKALLTDCGIIFVLYGNVCSISEIVGMVKKAGKRAIVHLDFIQGLSSRDIAVDFIQKTTGADGIISTKLPLVKRAMELGLVGILRAFIVDSIALDNTKKQLSAFLPDALEILPGVIPRVIREIRIHTRIPVIAGGLISDKREIIDAFKAGADAVSTTREALWYS
ncbi:MAG: glycerol-3-phosphate responsive antiterminator [Candidatus Limivivens sp.]|nr:glycerol-3-phosphate responsive antiterminator [Candidatus Limivivens sp.]